MERGVRRQMTGTVVSDKMEKTRVVAVQRWKIVPKYKKRIRTTTKVKAHDEAGTTQVGDTVRLVECRPISRDKRWRIAQVLHRSEAPGGDQE